MPPRIHVARLVAHAGCSSKTLNPDYIGVGINRIRHSAGQRPRRRRPGIIRCLGQICLPRPFLTVKRASLPGVALPSITDKKLDKNPGYLQTRAVEALPAAPVNAGKRAGAIIPCLKEDSMKTFRFWEIGVCRLIVEAILFLGIMGIFHTLSQ